MIRMAWPSQELPVSYTTPPSGEPPASSWFSVFFLPRTSSPALLSRLPARIFLEGQHVGAMGRKEEAPNDKIRRAHQTRCPPQALSTGQGEKAAACAGASDQAQNQNTKLRTASMAQVSSVLTPSPSRVDSSPRATSQTPKNHGPSCKSQQAKGIVQSEKEKKTQAVLPASPAGLSMQER